MDWNEVFKIIGITTGPQVLLVIIIGFWGKKIIEFFFTETVEIRKKELEQELENYKQNLEHENKNLQLGLDKNLETYKNRLELLRLEFQVQFAELHAKRSKIIARLYRLLSELSSSMLDLTAKGHFVIKDAEKEEQDRFEKANSAFIGFSKYYLPHKIYFPEEISEKFDNILQFLWDQKWNFSFIKGRINNGDLDIEEWKQYSKELREISEKVSKDSINALKDLENEFRELLGVNSKKVIEQLREKVEK